MHTIHFIVGMQIARSQLKVHVHPTLLQEGGVNCHFDGTQMAFRGTLTVLSADNLAAWNIGGFKALASAFRKCQYCMVVDEDMQTKVCMYILCSHYYTCS